MLRRRILGPFIRVFPREAPHIVSFVRQCYIQFFFVLVDGGILS